MSKDDEDQKLRCPIGNMDNQDCTITHVTSYDRKVGIGLYGLEEGEYGIQTIDVLYCLTHKFEFKRYNETEY